MNANLSGKLDFDYIPKKKQERILATDILQYWFFLGIQDTDSKYKFLKIRNPKLQSSGIQVQRSSKCYNV